MSGQNLDRRSTFLKQKSVTMEYFLETSNVDASTAALLRKYDKDGDGSFSKDEVVDIIVDLRKTIKANETLGHYNTIFKRVLVSAVIFSLFLLAAMFGLSYAVAKLNRVVEVGVDGTLVSTGDGLSVSTNSRAHLHFVERSDAGFCLTGDEVTSIVAEIVEGRNVLLEMGDYDVGESQITTLSGASSTYELDGRVCFTRTSDDVMVCIEPDPNCVEENSSGRRLSQEEREQHRSRLPEHYRRRLPPSGSQGGNACTCDGGRRRLDAHGRLLPPSGSQGGNSCASCPTSTPAPTPEPTPEPTPAP